MFKVPSLNEIVDGGAKIGTLGATDFKGNGWGNDLWNDIRGKGVGKDTAKEDLEYRKRTSGSFGKYDDEYFRSFLGDQWNEINAWEKLGLGGKAPQANPGIGQAVGSRGKNISQGIAGGVQGAIGLLGQQTQRDVAKSQAGSNIASASINNGATQKEAIQAYQQVADQAPNGIGGGSYDKFTKGRRYHETQNKRYSNKLGQLYKVGGEIYKNEKRKNRYAKNKSKGWWTDLHNKYIK